MDPDVRLLHGAPLAARVTAATATRAAALRSRGTVPTLSRRSTNAAPDKIFRNVSQNGVLRFEDKSAGSGVENPGWAQAVAWCLPLTHAVALSRACVAGTVGLPAVLHLAVLLAVLGLSYALAVRWVGRRLIA